MPWRCSYTPIELHQFNPYGFDYGDLVVLPDGRTGMVSKAGFKYGWVDADAGADWRGLLAKLRPEQPAEIGQPRVQQLALS